MESFALFIKRIEIPLSRSHRSKEWNRDRKVHLNLEIGGVPGKPDSTRHIQGDVLGKAVARAQEDVRRVQVRSSDLGVVLFGCRSKDILKREIHGDPFAQGDGHSQDILDAATRFYLPESAPYVPFKIPVVIHGAEKNHRIAGFYERKAARNSVMAGPCGKFLRERDAVHLEREDGEVPLHLLAAQCRLVTVRPAEFERYKKINEK